VQPTRSRRWQYGAAGLAIGVVTTAALVRPSVEVNIYDCEANRKPRPKLMPMPQLDREAARSVPIPATASLIALPAGWLMWKRK
jgi:hypothetical protein